MVSSQKIAGNAEGATRPTAGDEGCEFFAMDGIMSRSPGWARATSSHPEGGRRATGRVPPFIEKLVSSQKLGGNRKALEGAKRPTAGDEPREFTSRGEGGRVPPFIEKSQKLQFMQVFIFRDKIDLSFIKVVPGDWVVLKPNLVKEFNEAEPDEWESVITSSRIIRLVCEYVCEKLNGKGKVTICDAPQTDSRFSEISRKLELNDISKSCREKYEIEVEVIDLRNEEWLNQDGIITERRKIAGDPRGSIAFNLGRNSLFYGYSGEGRYYGADYDSKVVNRRHRGDRQEYLICATPILADVFINLPKMKTHKKAGVTLNLKNLVGINADKNWLPHHTDCDPKTGGGDQFAGLSPFRRIEQRGVKMVRRFALRYPRFGTRLARLIRKAGTRVFGDGKSVIRSGNWHGNDTTWRMVLDLNRCLLFGNPDGSLRCHSPKRYYCLIDGIIGMEGAGPMHGKAVNSNVVVGGSDPAAVDMVASRVMGFDWRKIPAIKNAFDLSSLPVTTTKVEDVYVESENPDWTGKFTDIESHRFLNFEPHFGWKGHIEYGVGN